MSMPKRQSASPFPHHARPRRRGDRVEIRFAAVRESEGGTFRTYSTALTTSVRRGKADIATARCGFEFAVGSGGNNASKSASLWIAA
jgi:hypothetical protein